MSAPSVNLDWLCPTLDRCRALIADRPVVDRWTKTSAGGATELVTDIDVAVDALLTDAIRTHQPDAAILSEESNPDPAALGADDCYVVDPIDGTDELAAGRPGFAISIALLSHGEPAAALVDLPAHNQRFHCAMGHGTTLNGAQVHLSQTTTLDDARLAVSATQLGLESLQHFWGSLAVAGLRPTRGFAAKFATMLAGDVDAILYLPIQPHRAAIWDYAAPAILLAEAGGWFGTLDGDNLLDRRPYTYTGGWIATPPALQTQLLSTARTAPDLD